MRYRTEEISFITRFYVYFDARSSLEVQKNDNKKIALTLANFAPVAPQRKQRNIRGHWPAEYSSKYICFHFCLGSLSKIWYSSPLLTTMTSYWKSLRSRDTKNSTLLRSSVNFAVVQFSNQSSHIFRRSSIQKVTHFGHNNKKSGSLEFSTCAKAVKGLKDLSNDANFSG